MMPFPSKAVEKHLKNADKIVCVEANGTGQLADLVKFNTSVKIKKKILKYDSREFEPLSLLKSLERWFK
jgi:2-oxoglutarate ferredoxin oxidoreductase subunit alpha